MAESNALLKPDESHKEVSVEQHRMPSSKLEYLTAFAAKNPGWMHDYKKISRDFVVLELSKLWPKVEGEDIEAFQIWQDIADAVKKLPPQSPEVFVRVSVVSSASAPMSLPQPGEAAAVATFDTSEGLSRSYLVPVFEELPNFDAMTISTGLMVVCQAVPPLNGMVDNRAVGMGAGASLFRVRGSAPINIGNQLTPLERVVIDLNLNQIRPVSQPFVPAELPAAAKVAEAPKPIAANSNHYVLNATEVAIVGAAALKIHLVPSPPAPAPLSVTPPSQSPVEEQRHESAVLVSEVGAATVAAAATLIAVERIHEIAQVRNPTLQYPVMHYQSQASIVSHPYGIPEHTHLEMREANEIQENTIRRNELAAIAAEEVIRAEVNAIEPGAEILTRYEAEHPLGSTVSAETATEQRALAAEILTRSSEEAGAEARAEAVVESAENVRESSVEGSSVAGEIMMEEGRSEQNETSTQGQEQIAITGPAGNEFPNAEAGGAFEVKEAPQAPEPPFETDDLEEKLENVKRAGEDFNIAMDDAMEQRHQHVPEHGAHEATPREHMGREASAEYRHDEHSPGQEHLVREGFASASHGRMESEGTLGVFAGPHSGGGVLHHFAAHEAVGHLHSGSEYSRLHETNSDPSVNGSSAFTHHFVRHIGEQGIVAHHASGAKNPGEALFAVPLAAATLKKRVRKSAAKVQPSQQAKAVYSAKMKAHKTKLRSKASLVAHRKVAAKKHVLKPSDFSELTPGD